MRRFRRKPRVVWLPVPGTTLNQQAGGTPLDPVTINPNLVEFRFTVQAQQPNVVNVPLVLDEPFEQQLTGGAPMAIWQSQTLAATNQLGYRLRRIVGDFCAVADNQNDQQVITGGVALSYGIMVRRVDESTGLMLSDGNVASVQNIRDPWICRRTVFLGGLDAGSRLGSMQFLNALPFATTDYGTKWHQAIDQKTARRIGPEERLFLSVSAWLLPLNRNNMTSPADIEPTDVWFWFDYRVLATISQNSGNRRNASR